MTTIELLQIHSQRFFVKNICFIYIEFSVVDSEDNYEYVSNVTYIISLYLLYLHQRDVFTVGLDF